MLTQTDVRPVLSHVPVRYKYQRLRERLRLAIRSGDLAGKLPGERELARRYNANAKTINKALSDLTTEGMLVRHVGRGTFVANGGRADNVGRCKPRQFGWLGPAGRYPHRQQAAYEQADQLISSHGDRLTRFGPVADAAQEVPEHALSPSELRDLDGLIVYASHPSVGFLANLHRRHLPVVIANNCHERIRTPAVVPDYAQGAFELCQHLIHLGHRGIELLLNRELLPAAGLAVDAYRAAMRRHGLVPHEAHRIPNQFDWDTVFLGLDRPTAVICVGAALAVWASRKALDAGLAAPAMLSIVALPGPHEPRLTDQSITTYEVPPEPIVDWATELLLSASPGQSPRTVIVPGRLIDRGSAAPLASAMEEIVTRAPEEVVV